MKRILILLFCSGLSLANEELLLIDKKMKLPPLHAQHFDQHQIFSDRFPIFLADRQVLIESVEATAKQIDRHKNCESSKELTKGRTSVKLIFHCQKQNTVSVWLITNMHDFKISFPLVLDETNMRKAQKHLLEFSSYLAKPSDL